MAKRKSGVDALFETAARWPWWVGVAAAFVAYLVLRTVAGMEVPLAPNTRQLGDSIVRQVIKSLALVGQWLLPLIFLAAAGFSFIGQRQRQRLHSDVAQRGNLAPFASMSWREFEELVGEYFRRRGFAASNNGRAGPDGGVDVVVSRGADRYIVQCKHWRALKVGVEPVRELYGVLHAQRAAGGFVVSSGTFTEEARRFAEGREIELIDGNMLARAIREQSPGKAPRGNTGAANHPGSTGSANAASGRAASAASAAAADPLCPVCGAAMQKRKAQRGPSAGQMFWGCTRFPNCRGTRPG